MSGGHLIAFDTHPIQYRSPVFRQIAERHKEFKVFYFNHGFDGQKWWYHERPKTQTIPTSPELTMGFEFHVLHTDALSVRQRYIALKQVIERERPGAIILHGYYSPENWILGWLARQLKIRIIFLGEVMHSSGPLLRRTLRRPVQKIFFSQVDRFIAIGDRAKAFYSDFPIDANKIIPAHYCVDVQQFNLPREQASKRRDAWRIRHGIPLDAFVNLFVGRLFDRKRPNDFISIHRKIRNPAFHSVMVGSGPMETEILKSTQDLHNFHYLGFQNQAALIDIYHGSDCLSLLSEYETWGLVANEASACGLPVIVTSECGVANDLVIEDETGYVVKVGDIDAAIARLNTLQEDKKRIQMGEAAQKRVMKEYSPDQFADAYLTAYEQL